MYILQVTIWVAKHYWLFTHLDCQRFYTLTHGLRYGWPTSFWKIWKRHSFQDIQSSFWLATDIGLKTHQNFFRKKILTIMVTRAVQNLGWNGPLRAGQLSNSKKLFSKLAQTCDEQMVKISERYLKPLLSNSKLTKFHWSC